MSDRPQNLIADIGVLIAITSPLAFQDMRIGGYEAHKVSIQTLAGFLTLSGLLCYQGREVMKRTPLNLTMIVAACFYLVISFLSLSPLHTWFNQTSNAQNMLYVFAMAGFVWYGTIYTARLRAIIVYVIPFVLISTFVYSFYAFITGNASSIEANLGNPNYLSIWLIVALFSFLAVSERSYKYGLWMLPGVLVSLIVNGSFAAFLSLAMAGFFIWSVMQLHRQRHQLVIYVSMALSLGILSLIPVTYQLRANQSCILPESICYTLYFRLDAWTASAYTWAISSIPLENADGQEDEWAALRPVIGYGISQTSFLHSRFDVVYKHHLRLDSTHNILWDTLLTTGAIGLTILLSFVLMLEYHLLKRLQIIAPGQIFSWFLVHIACAGLIHLFLVTLISGNFPLVAGYQLGLLPISIGLSIPVSLWCWIVIRYMFNTTIPAALIYHRWLFAAFIVLWVEIQFGFLTSSVVPLLALLIGYSLHAEPIGQNDTQIDDRTSYLLALSVSLCGMWWIIALGDTITSDYFKHSVGDAFILVSLLCVLLAVFTFYSPQRLIIHTSKWLAPGWKILATWAIIFVVESIIRFVASEQVEVAYLAFISQQDYLIAAFLLVNILGMMPFIFTLLVSWWFYQIRPPISARVITLVFLLLCFGMAYQQTRSSLHGLANTYAASGAENYSIAEVIYTSAYQIGLDTDRLVYDWMWYQGDDAQIDKISPNHPYYQHTRGFQR